jgi:hypothetical protein
MTTEQLLMSAVFASCLPVKITTPDGMTCHPAKPGKYKRRKNKKISKISKRRNRRK